MAAELTALPKGATIAFIHAKGTSDRLPGKNMRILGKMPLVCHAIWNAQCSGVFDAIIIDSEDVEILKVGQSFGAIPIQRNAKHASNDTTGDDLAVNQCRIAGACEAACVVQVVPTSPFIKPESTAEAVKIFRDADDVNSVVGCRWQNLYVWQFGHPDYRLDGRLPNSTELAGTLHETTGLYVMNPKQVLASGLRVDSDHCVPYMLSAVESIDINDADDWELAETVQRGLNA